MWAAGRAGVQKVWVAGRGGVQYTLWVHPTQDPWRAQRASDLVITIIIIDGSSVGHIMRSCNAEAQAI